MCTPQNFWCLIEKQKHKNPARPCLFAIFSVYLSLYFSEFVLSFQFPVDLYIERIAFLAEKYGFGRNGVFYTQAAGQAGAADHAEPHSQISYWR